MFQVQLSMLFCRSTKIRSYNKFKVLQIAISKDLVSKNLENLIR